MITNKTAVNLVLKVSCCKHPKNWDSLQKKCCYNNYPKICGFTEGQMCPKDVNRMANSVNPDQTAPSGHVKPSLHGD